MKLESGVLIVMFSCQKSFHESCRYRFLISFWQQCLSVKDLLSTKSFFDNISFDIFFFSISQRKDFIIKHSSTWPKANIPAEKVLLTICFIFIDFHAIGENFSFLCRNLMNPPWDEFPFKLALHLESMEF